MKRVLLAIAALTLLIPASAWAATAETPVLHGGWLLAAIVSALALGNLLGSGIIPSGAVGTELTAVTRRAFVPKCVVQIYKATPTLAAGLANAQTASGGVSSVVVPVQGTSFVTAQATDYSGSFTAPAVAQGITEADYNLKAVVVPIPFLGMEGLVQLNAAVIPLIEARMNDAGNVIAAYLSTQLWTNATANSVNIDGFPLITTNSSTYGNIASRTTTNSWFGANVPTAVSNSPLPTRQSVLVYIVSAAKAAGGEMPNIGICGPGTWVALAQDFVGQEQYMITPGSSFDQSQTGARAAFTALMVAGVPIYIDMDSPEGQFLFYNTRYDSFYIHEAAAFAFTGFASTLPNMQLGYVGALVSVLEHINVKPKTVTLITGYSSLATSL